MGNSSYDSGARFTRSANMGYQTKAADQIFTQSEEMRAHKEMHSRGITFRECRDSDAHPTAIPVQLYLDVTGSMGHIPHHIPHHMIKEGLPTLMGTLIEQGVPDVALMFGAIGDHVADRYPLQVGQFESGDAELDMWLTRTYLEGNGGGNGGESYLLAWYFAANHVRTDAYEKRKQKGFVFTVGDECCLPILSGSAIKELMGLSETPIIKITREALLLEAAKTNHVFHIHVSHRSRAYEEISDWKQLIGESLIVVQDYADIPKIIAKTIIANLSNSVVPTPAADTATSTQPDNSPEPVSAPTIML